MSLLDTASLIVTPNGYKEGKLYSVIPSDGSGDMSVTRATTATRVNSAGLVELVPYNLLQYSEQFNNGVWGAVDTTITALTADTMVISSSTSRVFQSTSLGAGTYTASVYVKSLSGTPTIQFRMVVDGVDITDSIPTTTEWVRHDYTFTASTSMDYFVLRGQSGTGSVAIWGAQLVEGSTAKDYQKTETRLNIPRLDYSNGTCPSLLVEPQRTNLLAYSEQFDNAGYWSIYQSSITGDTTTAPNGTQTADTLTALANTGGDAYRLINFSGTHTASCYIKAGTSNKARIGFSSGEVVFYDLSTGVVTTSGVVTGSMVDAGNGWWRCIATVNSTTIYTAFSNDGTNGQTVYLWGAQLEAGSYATSYIPTTSASVTRNVDLVAKTGISSLIGQTEGTCFIDFNYDNSTAQGNPLLFSFRNTAWTNEVYAQILASGGIQVQTYLGGVQQSYLYYGGATNGHHKLAYAYKQNDFILYVDGVQVATDTSGNVPATDDFCLGYFNTSFTPTANYNAAALWKTRLTNTQLAQLTTI
jgi:hypothetical protein